MDYFGRTKRPAGRDDDVDWKCEIGTVSPDHVATDVRRRQPVHHGGMHEAVSAGDLPGPSVDL